MELVKTSTNGLINWVTCFFFHPENKWSYFLVTDARGPPCKEAEWERQFTTSNLRVWRLEPTCLGHVSWVFGVINDRLKAPGILTW